MRNVTRHNGRSKGFTLVELLVVIGIIALLIGILLPSLSKAREKSREVACSSNLHQMGIAMALYVNEWGYYPGNLGLHNNTGGPVSVWQLRLRKYMNGNANVFLCPSEDDSFRWTEATTFGKMGALFASALDSGFGYQFQVHGNPNLCEKLLFTAGAFNGTTPENFSYGYNDWGCFTSGPVGNVQEGMGGDIFYNAAGVADPVRHELKAARTRMPSEMIAIADRVPSVYYYPVTKKTYSTTYNYNIDPTTISEWPATIHRKGANVLYADGHVTWGAQADLVNVACGGKDDPGPKSASDTSWAHTRQLWNTTHNAYSSGGPGTGIGMGTN